MMLDFEIQNRSRLKNLGIGHFVFRSFKFRFEVFKSEDIKDMDQTKLKIIFLISP